MSTPNEMPPVPAPEITSDDRVWVLLCFLFTPIFPIITLLIEDKKNRPFIKYHTMPTLILGVAEVILVSILGWIPFIGPVFGLVWILNLIWGIKANGGVNVDIPVITEYSKKQGWS
jgi:uncharacterized membrane protein